MPENPLRFLIDALSSKHSTDAQSEVPLVEGPSRSLQKPPAAPQRYQYQGGVKASPDVSQGPPQGSGMGGSATQNVPAPVASRSKLNYGGLTPEAIVAIAKAMEDSLMADAASK